MEKQDLLKKIKEKVKEETGDSNPVLELFYLENIKNGTIFEGINDDNKEESDG